MARYMIFGASKGLGYSLAVGLPKIGDEVFLISRSKPDLSLVPTDVSYKWVKADLSCTDSIDLIKNHIMEAPVDVFIYNAGIWETEKFENISKENIIDIYNVNVISLIYAIQRFINNIKTSTLKKIVLIGSTCGLDNEGAKSVIYTSTKFALRGVCHSLRENYREDGISITAINPGSMATDIPYKAGIQEALNHHKHKRMPVGDIVEIVRTIISLSPATTIKEIDIPAQYDTDI